MRLPFVFVLLICLPTAQIAQPRFDIPLNGTHHMLPVAYPENDTQLFVQLTDTFFIKNNRNEEAYVDFSMGGYIPQTTLKNKIVAPFGINAITYADQIKVMPNTFQWIRTGAYYKTKKERGTSLYINAFVAGSDTPVRNKHGKIIRFEKQNIDGLTRDVIKVNEELVPTAYGTQLIDSDSAVGTWHYFEPDTFPIIIQHAKRVRIRLQNPQSASNEITISVKRNNHWSELKYGKEGNTFIGYVDASIDSLKLENNGLVAEYHIKYESISENHHISLYLLKPTSEFYIQNGVKWPLNFDTNKVILVWNHEGFSGNDSNVIDARSAAIRLQKEFENITISPYKENGAVHLLDYSNASCAEKKHILEALIQKSYIDRICGFFIDDQSNRTYYADHFIHVQFDEHTNNTQIAEIAAKYNFDLHQRFYSGTTYMLKYKRPVFDLSMLRDLQALGMHPNVLSASPNTYYTVEFPGIDPPTPILRPIKPIENKR